MEVQLLFAVVEAAYHAVAVRLPLQNVHAGEVAVEVLRQLVGATYNDGNYGNDLVSIVSHRLSHVKNITSLIPCQ